MGLMIVLAKKKSSPPKSSIKGENTKWCNSCGHLGLLMEEASLHGPVHHGKWRICINGNDIFIQCYSIAL